MVTLQAILAFIVLVGILVFIHELGHFLAARWCGMRADVFAVGMGPRLFGWNRRTGFTFGKLPEGLELEGDTDYRISAFPIGGYVKIIGMVDESMDTDFVGRPPEPWEFRSKNTLQKAFVISAGVIMNFLLAIVVFAGLNLFRGKEYRATTVVGPIPATSPATEAGLREGDKITAINGKTVQYFEEIPRRIYLEEADNDVALAIERGGMPLVITIPRSKIGDPEKNGLIIPVSDKQSVTIGGVVPGTPAEKAGLKPNDVILAVDGAKTISVTEFQKYVGATGDRPIAMQIGRDGTTLVQSVTPKDGKIGVEISDKYTGSRVHVNYGFGEAIAAGWDEMATVTAGTFGLVGRLFTGGAKLKDSVGGPGMIAKTAQEYASRGIPDFLSLMAVLSVTLACMNILPIPALDGGHLVFILIEGVTRREVPIKIRMAVQQVGFVLLIVFMAFVVYNDAVKLIGR